MGDPRHVVPRGNYALGEEEPDRQLAVVTGRPHGDGQGVARRANLQRLLDHHVVSGGRLRHAAGDAAHLPPADSFDRARHDSFIFSVPSSSTNALKDTPQ